MRKRPAISSLTAISASDTGDEAPLIQFFSSVRNSDRASAPAWRTVSVRRAASRARLSGRALLPASPSAKGQSLDPQRRRVDAIAKHEIVRRHQRLEDVEQVTGDRHFADGVGDLAVLDPEAGGAAAVVAGHAVDARADQ